MKCPACEKVLSVMVVDEITLDVCENGCGGIWFDNFELKKLDEKHETAGEQLLDIPRDPNLKVDLSQKRQCPRCENVTMTKHFFSVKHQVEVDECYKCGGIWLDYGELGQIRSQFEDEQARKQAAHSYFDEMTSGLFDKMIEEEQGKLERIRKITRMFRFMCPTYYLPGKQKWGAF